MLNTLLLMSIGLFVSNLANAGTMDPINTQNGFYIAGDLGVADLMNKEFHAINPESHQLGSLGLVGGGYLGYDYGLLPLVRLAIEGFADATALNTNLEHANITYSMNQRYHIGVRLLPEYVFTPATAGHLIFGYTNGRFNIQDNGVYGLINTGYNQGGFQTGLGLTTALWDHVFVRLDGLYNTYPSLTKTGNALAGTSPSYQLYTNKFSQLTGEGSVIYKF